MRQLHDQITVETRGQGLIEITEPLRAWLARQDLGDGLLTLYIRHTSASLLIQENADPDVRHDLERFLTTLVPEDPALYRHTAEGPDDMPAHIKAALTQTHLGDSPSGPPAGPRDLAGGLPLRAPPRATPARGFAASDRGIELGQQAQALLYPTEFRRLDADPDPPHMSPEPSHREV